MNSYFFMKAVCPFFLLKVQRPLSSIFIVGVDKVQKGYVVTLRSKNEVQLKSFIEYAQDVGSFEELFDGKSELQYVYDYTPFKEVI